MSQDKNNNQFILRFTNGDEAVTLDDNYTVEVLTKFTKSGSSRLTSGVVRRGYATWEFDTDYITQNETVHNYVYVRKSGGLVVSADSNAFHFEVGLSEIDKDAGRVAETYDENYQKYLDEFKGNVDLEKIAQAEQGRKDNETERVLAERERKANEEARELAEDERENAEEQRQTDHANRSAELAGKADKVVLNNLLLNGNFTVERNWTGQNSTIDYVDNKLIVTGDGTLDYPQVFQYIKTNSQHKYYARVVLEKIDTTIREFRVSTSTFGGAEIVKEVGADTEYILSGVIEETGNALRVYGRFPAGTSDGKSFMVSEILYIDLTETFGAGNEPTKEEMDELIKVTGYIDGEYALNNKEILGHLMKGIGEKANKKQEDWITPTLLNGWVEQSSSQTLEYMKDEFGFVHFRGCIKDGTAPLVFNLPEGYRPRGTRRFPVTSGDSTIQNIIINNNLVQIRGNPSAYAYLDNVVFEAER